MSDIAELKRFVKSLQQASSEQVCVRHVAFYPSFIFDLLIFDSFDTGNHRYLASVEEGSQNHRGRSEGASLYARIHAPLRSHRLPPHRSRKAKPALL